MFRSSPVSNSPLPSKGSILPDNGILWRTIQKLDDVGIHKMKKNLNSDVKGQITRNYLNRVSQGATVIYYQATDVPNQNVLVHNNGFYSAVSRAWVTHGNLILSCDDIWMCVQLQFCKYMEYNAEALRHVFVDHEDKKKLVVNMPNGMDWPSFMELLMNEIQANVKTNVNEDFLPEFSNTTGLQRLLKRLAVMDVMQHYFEYGMSFACGIEKIGFTGTLADWQLLRKTVQGLSQFHLKTNSQYFESLNNWIKDLLVIIDQFIDAYNGKKIDKTFWNNILHTRHTQGSGASTYIDGWILTLLVADYKQEVDIKDIPSHRYSVPVEVNDNGNKFQTRVLGGFTGVVFDEPTNTYWSQCSLVVIKD